MMSSSVVAAQIKLVQAVDEGSQPSGRRGQGRLVGWSQTAR